MAARVHRREYKLALPRHAMQLAQDHDRLARPRHAMRTMTQNCTRPKRYERLMSSPRLECSCDRTQGGLARISHTILGYRLIQAADFCLVFIGRT
jgi:hypothetical protein